MDNLQERLHFNGDLTTVLKKIVSDFNLGMIINHSVIQVGFEDYNVKLKTDSGEFVIKIFSKNRTQTEILRNIEIIQHAVNAGVNHPPVYYYNDSLLYTEPKSKLQLIVMKFINGKTFYDMSRSPDSNELAQIAAQAVKINNIDHAPPFLFDSWAVSNLKPLYENTKDHLDTDTRQLVEQVIVIYNAMPFSQLPTCFVHGDIIKSNLIKGNDGKIYIIDFSVANTYPRIQELAVIAANLLAGENQTLSERVQRITDAYLTAGGTLTSVEIDNLFNYALVAAAMEYLGSINERLENGESDEVSYWQNQGIESLREALRLKAE